MTEITFENQFNNELNDAVPDLNKEYFITPNTKDTGITLEMKSILIYNVYPALFNKLIITFDKTKLNKITTERKWTVLMIAAKNSKLLQTNNLIKILVDHGCDINSQSNVGTSALVLASAYSNTTSMEDTVEILIKNKADINLSSIEGLTALSYSCISTNYESTENTVEILLKNGADPNTIHRNDFNKTLPLLLLTLANINSGLSTKNTVKLLLKHGILYKDQSIFTKTYVCELQQTFIKILQDELSERDNKIKELTQIKGIMSEQDIINSHVLKYI